MGTEHTENAISTVRDTTCPACGFHLSASFFDGGRQPLATLAWPQTEKEARELKRLRLDFVRCLSCGHVFNPSFDYAEVPYTNKPNLMFNRATIWSGFIGKIQERILDYLPENPVVVEIGHGDASFLSSLATKRPSGQYIGFDPHGAESAPGVELRRSFFDPAVHLAELSPDIVISRHVLEHFFNPLGFLQRIAFFSANIERPVRTYFEVPCIDNALSSRRTVDFYYEHSSQFTSLSFRRMLEKCSAEIDEIGHGYDNEVIFSFAMLGGSGTDQQQKHFCESNEFAASATSGLDNISSQLETIHASGKRVAIWGGTGKSAAFICRYGLDKERFPVIVDSDILKVGTYVPGSGQEIRFRDYLKTYSPEIVIIPPQWRARDIIKEMADNGISAETILIEHDGKLVEFF